MFIDSHFLGTGIEWQRRKAEPKPPISAQPPKAYAPLICRVVRAVRVLGAGLGFPVGAPSVFTSDVHVKLCFAKIKDVITCR